MPTVTIPTPAVAAGRRGFTLNGKLGRSVHLPLAPTGGEHAGRARKWQQVPRPGRTDVLADTGPGLPTATYALVVTYGDGRSIAANLKALVDLAGEENNGIAIAGLGAFESDTTVLWRITDLTVTITHRRENNDPKRAEITLQLGAVTEVRTKVGKSKKPPKRKAA